MSLSEMLQYSTIRIEGIDINGNTSIGTGFFFLFLENQDIYKSFPVIITNKHVVENNTSGNLLFTLSDENGKPIDKSHHTFKITDFQNAWKFHPDPNVDLCAMPIKNIIILLNNQGKIPYFTPFTKELIPTSEQLEDLGSIEDIIMAGYPIGIWDNINNQPILRKGITATHPNKDYCGRKEFMVDIACFPGSSGSPIIILNENSYKDKSGNIHIGKSRMHLLGVLYAGPQYTISGEIKIITIPTRQVLKSVSYIPSNLGLVIKSEKIMELENLFC